MDLAGTGFISGIRAVFDLLQAFLPGLFVYSVTLVEQGIVEDIDLVFFQFCGIGLAAIGTFIPLMGVMNGSVLILVVQVEYIIQFRLAIDTGHVQK